MISAADLQTETVQFPSDSFTIKAFLARPTSAKGQASAVIVIQEWWGLNDHIKDIAQRFAREGYAALAPDLYSRLGYKVTKDPNEAAKLMEALSSQAALRDLNAATNFLQQQPFVDPQRIGVVGFCMGGTFALMTATHNSTIKASVPFYGKVPPIETLNYLLCPVLYHYGAKDGWVTRQEVDRLKEGLAKFGKPGEVQIYPEAGHAFFNETRPDAYCAEDAKRAWERTLAFLAKYLR
jgi:carboxymethylenebutenolidase